ncbi:MAG TPA: hypothetical protein VFO40_01530, partial [Chthoniobacterales bacterium]|nr:hypothetical protein [Chthoniobacterales bacterium]
ADKAAKTLAFIKETLRDYANPVINCSFGKDSMVLLHLCYANALPMHILYYRDPFFPRKNRFADSVIDSWNLSVHSYPPIRTSLLHGKEMVALVSEYQSGPLSTVAVLKNTSEYTDGTDAREYLCAVSFLTQPCGSYQYPWDVALIGHKDVDEDQIYGVVPLHSPIVMRDEGPDLIFPLKEWTHDDIWDYTVEFNVPVQMDRYDVVNRREWPDKTFNSDWYPTCIRCVDKRTPGKRVFCPKLNREIVNVSDQASEYGFVPDYFGPPTS